MFRREAHCQTKNHLCSCKHPIHTWRPTNREKFTLSWQNYITGDLSSGCRYNWITSSHVTWLRPLTYNLLFNQCSWITWAAGAWCGHQPLICWPWHMFCPYSKFQSTKQNHLFKTWKASPVMCCDTRGFFLFFTDSPHVISGALLNLVQDPNPIPELTEVSTLNYAEKSRG